MARIVSFIVLLVILLVIFAVFFQVMADFLLPMFLAVLLVIIFGPVHRWLKTQCRNHDRLAALLTTGTILLAFFLPASFILMRAAQEGGNLYRQVVHHDKKSEGKESAAKGAAEKGPPSVENNQPSAEDEKAFASSQKGMRWFSTKIAELGGKVGLKFDDKDIESRLRAKLEQYLTPLALSTGQFLVKFTVGIFVMILSLYYFLADGPAMIRGSCGSCRWMTNTRRN